MIRLLRKGGFGDVYLGEHLREKALVAIKVLQEPLTTENIREFVTEAGTQRLLRHDHIVRLLDFGIGTNQLPFLIMEYAPGGSLADRHPPGSRLLLESIVSYLKPLSAALQYAHDKGLIHRDIKPANFLIGTNGKVLLGDFGIAAIALNTRSRERQREEQKVVGSWAYAAPEQFMGKAIPASDQYSLAVVIYEWLCGQRPFHGNFDQLVVQHYHLKSPPPPLHEKMSISPAVEHVVMRALAKAPEQRFESVLAFAEAFVACSVPSSHSKPQLMMPLMNDPAPVVQPTVLPLLPAQAPHPADPAAITKAPAAVCELEVGGRSCGVQAVGRCSTCGRSFCATHQAWSGQTYYIDQCAPCFAQAQADKEKRRREAEEKNQTELKEGCAFLQSGSARAALRAAGVRPVKIYHTEWKRRFFGLSNRSVEVVTSIQQGWILGSLIWDVFDEGAGHKDRGLAALLDVDTYKLICVEPYLESYKNYVFYRDYWQIGYDSRMWIEAAQAVRRLIELSHLGVQSIFTRRIPAQQGSNPLGFVRIEEGKEAGRIYEIHKAEVSIGRGRKSDIFLEDFAVDELHATIINQGNGNYVLRVDTEYYDTRVNGQLLPSKNRYNLYKQDQTYPLQDGDHIQLSGGGGVLWVFSGRGTAGHSES